MTLSKCLAIATLLLALQAHAQDCSQVPAAYRAQCEARLAGAGAAPGGARMSDQIQGAQAALDACKGKTGEALKTCVVQNSGPGLGEADCSALPAARQPRCEGMKKVAAEAKETCKSTFDAADRTAFNACLSTEIRKHRPH